MYEFDPSWLEKVEQLRADGSNPYPNGFEPTHTSQQLHERYRDVSDPSQEDDSRGVAVGGRVMYRNRMGKILFLRVLDRGEAVVVGTDDDGNDVVRDGIIQVWVRRDVVGTDVYNRIKKLDIGDFVFARGDVVRTRTGELTLAAAEIALAGKTMLPFPDRHHSVTDIELRSRQRYVDLFMNGPTRDTFRMRSRIIRWIRDFFEDRDFLEVETPILHPIPGGATARPFETHHNALDMQLFMRVAPELYLKRLIVGGLERVFEINRSFRNEGVSVKHNPEFTMLEFYQAWATYEDLMDLTEELFVGVTQHVRGTLQIAFNGMDVDLSPPFRRASMGELIAEATGLSAEGLRDPETLRAYWVQRNPEDASSSQLPTTWGKWWEWYFDAFVEHTLVNPTFVTQYPTEISPLSRRNDADPDFTDRFEFVIATWEIANAFSELNDPVDQAARFSAQVAERDSGDDEAMHFDADYIRALSYGMPPTAGEGIGIDRLVMLLTGKTSIREVILFPTLRPEGGSAQREE
jgi:lysyl-tRNA synthetase class 2